MQLGGQPSNGQASANWFLLFVRSLAVPLEVTAHRGMGARYFDLRSGAAAVVIWLMPLLFPASDPRPVWYFLVFYLFMNIRARIEAFVLSKRGYAVHSAYSGVPVLCRWRPGWKELTVKRFIEPALAMVLGCAVAHWLNTPLGVLFALCGVSTFIDVSEAVAFQRRRQMDVQDAVIDAQSLRQVRR